MAKIHSEKKNGKKYFRLSICVDETRTRIGLGYDFNQRALSKLEDHATQLESLRDVGEKPDAKLLAEINGSYSGELLGKFAELGLLNRPAPKLGEFLTDYISGRSNLADHTEYKLKNSKRLFLEAFGDVRIGTISMGEVEDYRQARLKKVRPSTVDAELKHGRQFFAYAVRKGFIAENPFEGFKIGAQVDTERRAILNSAMLTDIVERLEDAEWQTFLALVRWTGCRQSEALLLKWSDIHWDTNKIAMPSSKTKHHGKGWRVVPLFPELLPYLLNAAESAPEGSGYVIHSLVKSQQQRSGRQGKNMGKPFMAFVKQLGYEPWAKPFQNIRVTRENELIRQGHPAHVVQAWIGHSAKVSEKHYLAVSDADFAKALESSSGQVVVSETTQEDADGNDNKPGLLNSRDSRSPAAPCDYSQEGQAPPAGLEPATRRLTAACSTN